MSHSPPSVIIQSPENLKCWQSLLINAPCGSSDSGPFYLDTFHANTINLTAGSHIRIFRRALCHHLDFSCVADPSTVTSHAIGTNKMPVLTAEKLYEVSNCTNALAPLICDTLHTNSCEKKKTALHSEDKKKSARALLTKHHLHTMTGTGYNATD